LTSYASIPSPWPNLAESLFLTPPNDGYWEGIEWETLHARPNHEKNLAATLSLPPPKIYTSFKTLHYPLDTIKVALASL
jgi:hypothetical protein